MKGNESNNGRLTITDSPCRNPPRSIVSICASILCAAVACISSNLTRGSEFYEAPFGRQPDHLVPISRFDDDYDERLSRFLVVTDGTLGRMLVRPSFQPEYCVSVYEVISKVSIKKHGNRYAVPDDGKAYYITVTTAAKSLWETMSENMPTKQSVPVKVIRIDRKISLELAIAIQRVWGKALQLTRYPAGATLGLDGTSYHFSVWVRGFGNIEGKTWSPKKGLPRDLVDIGEDLISFGRQDAKGKSMTEQQLIDRLQKLEETIPKR